MCTVSRCGRSGKVWGRAQHVGLGNQLIEEALRIAHRQDFRQVAVISAIGNVNIILQRGFRRGELYLLHD